ncbi:MAG: DNA gyrase/topoisomerase IV subunit A [Paludibacter sp.]|nr:DNA gyrase/topoisomerase IV subunit A [Paludibacter sp.]
MSTDEIIEAENEENEMTGAADEIVSETESAAHSTYKVPKISDDAVKHHLSGMYQNWFLDYASYVILERAVPDIYDGLKPVQRRILHSMKRLDDGRYNKVANIVGHTMQFHPHGDASIGDALVQLGQKDLLIDCQGNWGNILTGDGAAAPRYIEARLSKFALETVFNPKTTEWKSSYDGRNKEPIALPVKFPLLLAQGVEGIAVGLNSKILPHNFNELLDACVAHLRGETFILFPDFQTGGSIDVCRYNDGERGGAVKIRAKIGKIDNKTLAITEIPFGTNTSKLIESIIKASDKGKIKIRKVDDNTSANVEILVHLLPGSSSDKTIDALYAFTDCELSISPNCCVIHDNKPRFCGVSEMLRISCEHTMDLLKTELEIQKAELQEQLFFTSLEKIFIENRIYKDKGFEDSTSQDEVILHIDNRLEPFKKDFIREIVREDFLKLLEIKMMRITKFDSDKANDTLIAIQKKIDEIDHHLANLVDYTIAWYEGLKAKYGKDHPRLTEIRNFETIVASKVVEANEKLYVNYDEGFIGTSLRKDEFVCNCSDIDDIIIFFKDGKYKVVKVADKIFVGKNILHLDVFKKNDKRTVYNTVYRDGKTGPYYIKRFAVNGITRDKDYDVTQGTAGSKVIYFTTNPNAEAEVIRVTLKPKPRLNKLVFEKDFSEIAIKGRQSMGNILTKNDIHKIALKQKGGSTLGGRQVWFDRDVLRLNYDNRGEHLGEFQSDDLILVVSSKGNFYTSNFDLNNHYDKDILVIEKFDSNKVWSVALWDAEQKFYYLKRFQLEPSAKPQNFLGDNAESRLMLMTDIDFPRFEVIFGGNDAFRETLVVDAEEFIGVKSYKAKGKRLSTFEVETINELEPIRFAPVKEESSDDNEGGENGENSDETELSEVEIADETNNAEVENTEALNEDTELAEFSDEPEFTVIAETPKTEEPKEKPTKPKKEKPIKPIEMDSKSKDDIIDQGRELDDITGQLTLF